MSEFAKFLQQQPRLYELIIKDAVNPAVEQFWLRMKDRGFSFAMTYVKTPGYDEFATVITTEVTCHWHYLGRPLGEFDKSLIQPHIDQVIAELAAEGYSIRMPI